ncbi:MAG: HAD-IA family hydrolase, partial [Firmicutes bacterium]|nr:HAD-IA family hydrolase [Bacillota bacterium]
MVDPEEFRPPDFSRADFLADFFGLDKARVRAAWEADVPRQSVDGRRTLGVFLRELLTAEGRPWPAVPGLVERFEREFGRYQDLALLHPLPGAEEALRQLRTAGVRLGLLSNAVERDCREWGRSPLRPYFDAVCLSYQTGHLKPHPEAYEAVLRRLNLEAAECAFVGDGGSGELEGARRAGFGLVALAAWRLPAAWVSQEERERRTRQAEAVVTDIGD